MSTLIISSGVVAYEDAVKKPVADTEPQYFPTKRARVELTFVVPDEEDGEAALDNAINLAENRVNQMLNGTPQFTNVRVSVAGPQPSAAPAGSDEPSAKRTRRTKAQMEEARSQTGTPTGASEGQTGALPSGDGGELQTSVADALDIGGEVGEQLTVLPAAEGSTSDTSASVTTASTASPAETPGPQGSSLPSSAGSAADVTDDDLLGPLVETITDVQLSDAVIAASKAFGGDAAKKQLIRELILSYRPDHLALKQFTLRDTPQEVRSGFLSALAKLVEKNK